MARLVLVFLSALVIACSQAINLGAYAGFQSLQGYPSLGPIYPAGPGVPKAKEQLTLTCAVNFTDPHYHDAGIINAISVTIKESNGALGGVHPSLLSYVGGYGGAGGLSASVVIYSARGGPVSVAFTYRARPEHGCYADDFGDFFTGVHQGFGLSPYGAYGAHGGYGSLGGYGTALGYGHLSGYGGYGYGAGAGFSGLSAFGGYGYSPYGYTAQSGDSYDKPIPGVIAKVNLTPGTASEINIDNLAGFKDIKELAGRGVVVCPNEYIDDDYHHAMCEGGILSCCALHYDRKDKHY